MTVLWIGGWGTSPEWGLTAVQRWRPDWNHEWVIPGAECAVQADGTHDWVGGYSFGAFLMLRCLADFPAKRGHFYVAPFLDLKREAGLGGLVATTQLKLTRRWLQRDPVQAVNDFYKRAGLRLGVQDALPYDKESLLWGINELLGKSAPITSEHLGPAVFGAEDPLVDAKQSAKFFRRSKIVEGAGHRLEALRGALNLS